MENPAPFEVKFGGLASLAARPDAAGAELCGVE